jgi:hypothetical protein
LKRNHKHQRSWAQTWKYFWGLRTPWVSPKNSPSANFKRMRLLQQMSQAKQTKRKGKKTVMRTKDVLTRTGSKLFDVSPESVDQFFRTTGLWEQPGMQEEMPEPIQNWLETLNMPLARIFVTSFLDALGVSMKKLEQTMKKG